MIIRRYICVLRCNSFRGLSIFMAIGALAIEGRLKKPTIRTENPIGDAGARSDLPAQCDSQ
jgi:hypothetical protein